MIRFPNTKILCYDHLGFLKSISFIPRIICELHLMLCVASKSLAIMTKLDLVFMNTRHPWEVVRLL